MDSPEGSNILLKKKYDLHKSPEVEAAANRTQKHTGERVAQDPQSQIQNYLNRFHEITDREDPTQREHGLEAFKRLIHRKYIIKPNEVPGAYFENQQRLAREQGHGDIEVTKEMRDQLTEVIIADQQSSLDKWIDYLSSPDAPYSDGLKYWTLRSVLNMAEYDKERKMYPQRSKGTTKPFPDLNREALAYVLDVVGKKYHGQQLDENSPELERLLQGENFGKLYAWAIKKVNPASAEQLAGTKGKWIKYNQGTDHMPLVTSLQGHGTGWCTAGESTAKTQLQDGDFYVFYSLDKDGKPTVPRAAIRMQGNQIAEVRGIAPEQNLDPAAVTIVEEKLKEFPDGPSYQKKVADMRHLTEIERKTKEGQQVEGSDLVFLYEIDFPIEGFGFDKDPRIKEIRSQRKIEEDMPVVFGCETSQIARSVDQINISTKAYVGKLKPGIFDKLQNIEHVYTSFPEGKIRRQTVEIGGKGAKQLEEELKQAGVEMSSYAQDMLRSPEFTTLPTPQNLNTVRLRVEDLGLSIYATTNQVFERAKELGLDLCPAEVGPHLRLQDKKQSIEDWYYIAMKPIVESSGLQLVFGLNRDEDRLWLRGAWAFPTDQWNPEDEFVFSLRKR